MPLIGGARSDVSVQTPSGSIGASSRPTWGDSWMTSRDNQDFKIYITDDAGHVSEAYVTQDQGRQLQQLRDDGHQLRTGDGRNIVVGSGLGSESLPTARGVQTIPTRLMQPVGDIAERQMARSVDHRHRQAEAVHQSGAYTTQRGIQPPQ